MLWNKDKQVLQAFKDCYSTFQESVRNGEEVDVSSVCLDESEALLNYTVSIIGNYKNGASMEISDKKTRYYSPKVPYFQNM